MTVEPSGLPIDTVDARLKPRVAGLVRQARRSGRIVIGVRQTLDSASAGALPAVFVADDLRADRRAALIERLRGTGTTVYAGWSKDELGAIAGRAAVAALTVSDRNIAAGLKALFSDTKKVEITRTRKERNRG